MTYYNNHRTYNNNHFLAKDPEFWKSLKRGDEVCGRPVVTEAKDTACGWPQLIDLMSDEGTGWMVCRGGFDEPACGCPSPTDEAGEEE